MGDLKKIFVVDKLVLGNNHTVFNAGFLSVLSKIYATVEIVFYSELSHNNNVRSKLELCPNISFECFKEASPQVFGLKRVYRWLKRKVMDLLILRNIVKQKKDIAYSFFFTTLSTTTMYYLNRYIRDIKIPIYIVIHGEVELLFKSDLSLEDKLRRFFYRKFIKNLSHNVSLIVLSGVVKDKLIETFNIDNTKIILMRHPIINHYNEKKDLNDKIAFAHIGSALKKKSSCLFFEIAQKIKTKFSKVDFILIGKSELGLVSKIPSEVTCIANNNTSISQNLYEDSIKKIDYGVFTFDNDNYVYRDSGAVMDSIGFRKPIIALKQDFFVSLFSLAGDIGFLCNDMEEMEEVIKKISNKDSTLIARYASQCENLNRLAELYTLNEIRELLQSQLIPINQN